MALTLDKPWDEAIYVILQKAGHGKVVDNTRSALNMLFSAWPVGEGSAFITALSICQSVLDNHLTPDHAKTAFLAAAAEAGVGVGDVARYLRRPGD